MSRSAVVVVASLAPASLLAGLACSSSFTVPEGPHPFDNREQVLVEAPPPVVKIERVPPRPHEDECLWLDGRWERAGGTWEWTPGAWVVLETGCHFAAPETAWSTGQGTGQLYYSRGRWYRSGTSTPCKAPPLCK